MDQLIHQSSIFPCFNFFFIIRRFLFAMILVHGGLILPRNFIVISIVLLNLMTLIYLWSNKNFEQTVLNRIEIFNESINIMISYIILIMTSISDGMTLAQLGLVLNYLVLFLFLSNILYVLSDILQSAF